MSSIQGAKNYSKYLHICLKSQNKQGTAKETLWYHKTNIYPKTLINLKEQTSEFAKLKFLSAFYLIIKTLRCLEGYGLWYNPVLSWQKITCFREWKENTVFISLFLVNTFQFWTIPPVFSRWEPGFGCSFKMQHLLKLESTDKIGLKNAVLGNTLEKKLWGF